MREHIRILGILNMAMGAMIALVGVVVFLVTGSVAGLIAASVEGDPHDAAILAQIIAGAGIGIALFFWILSLPSIVGGWGLLNFRPWSRLLMVVVSVLHLFHIPFGTALGVYGLWVLFSDDARRLLGNRTVGYGTQQAFAASAGAGSSATYPPAPPRPPV